MSETVTEPRRRLPPWFKRPLGGGPEFTKLSGLVSGLGLHTVCQSARCPNQGECWTIGTATFMILGDICTRGCRYCAVPKGKPLAVDFDEPARVGQAVVAMNLRHAVITSVDRDDLADGGASIWAETIRAIRAAAPGCAVEVLVPDFRKSDDGALETVMAAKPDILNHNIETVPRLFPLARKGGDYEFSIDFLRRAKAIAPATPTKSGIMLGLGERDDEVRRVLGDLREAGVEIVSMGQYLAPERNAFYLPVARFVHPDEFAAWARYGKDDLGFRHVEAGPLVRSSYHAEKQAGGTRAGERAVRIHAVSDYLDQPLEPDPVIEAYKKDVDVTLLIENLKLTVEERFRQLESMARFVESARRAREAAERQPTSVAER